MRLLEDYLQRNSINDLLIVPQINHGILPVRLKEGNWRIYEFQWFEPTKSPGYYQFSCFEPIYNSYRPRDRNHADSYVHLMSTPHQIAWGDDWQSYVLDFARQIRPETIVPREELWLFVVEVFGFIFDEWIAHRKLHNRLYECVDEDQHPKVRSIMAKTFYDRMRKDCEHLYHFENAFLTKKNRSTPHDPKEFYRYICGSVVNDYWEWLSDIIIGRKVP